MILVESLNASSIVCLDPGHQGLAPIDARGVARINPPCDVSCNSNSLDACVDISSRMEQNKIEGPIDLGDYVVSCIVDGTFFLDRRQCIHMAIAILRRFHHPVVMAAYSCIHSSIL